MVFEGAEGLTLSTVPLDSVDGIDADQSVLGICVERKAAPGPILRVIDQFSLQWIHVHVVQLFDSLLQAPHIEIVEATLPETWQRTFAICKAQVQLSSISSVFPAQAPGDALFQNLNRRRGRSFCRLANEEMDVLRHHDISNKRKPVAVPDLAENLNERVLGTNRTQERYAPIATERDEMQMPAPVNPNELVSHGSKENTKTQTLRNSRRVCHPEKQDEANHSALTYWSGIIQA